LNTADIVIVGAGVSGLVAANYLQELGLNVLVLDKGRSVGGRLATRRIQDGIADHGAQFFTARTMVFQQQVDTWLAQGLLRIWGYGWSDGSLKRSAPDGHPRYIAEGGMNNLAQHLAKPLNNVKVGIEIGTISFAKGIWTLTANDNSVYTCKMVLMTPPVPQSLKLLEGLSLNASVKHSLERIQYSPCLAGMFAVEGEISLPEPGAIQNSGAPAYWIGDNRAKGISQQQIITVHIDGLNSRQRYDLPDEDNLSWITELLKPLLGETARVTNAQLKKWRYASPLTTHPFDTLLCDDMPLAFAGDAFGGRGRVEGAYLSGLAAGKALAERFKD
jgi:renalase